MKSILLTLPLVLLCACAKNQESHAADNTAKNARDRSGTTLTPTDQKESEADRGITQKVRQSLMGDDSLSTNAKNVKVITVNGRVTLRGIVESQEEKDSIEHKVQALAGAAGCDNQLEVKAN